MRNSLILFTLIGLFLMIPEMSDAQCAMCKSAVESNEENMSGLGDGLNSGILYLMAIPYLLFGGIVTAIILTVRKKRREQQMA